MISIRHEEIVEWDGSKLPPEEQAAALGQMLGEMLDAYDEAEKKLAHQQEIIQMWERQYKEKEDELKEERDYVEATLKASNALIKKLSDENDQAQLRIQNLEFEAARLRPHYYPHPYHCIFPIPMWQLPFQDGGGTST